MATVGSVRIGVSAQVGDFLSGMDGARKRLRRFQDDLFSVKTLVAGALLGGAAHAIAGEIGSAVVAASDLNEQLSKSRTVFGDAAGQVERDAQAMADAFGVPKTQFIDAASSIGLIGKASGLTQGAAAELGSNFAKLAIDASSFYNVPLEEALMALRSGLVGEAEPLRRYGVLLSEAAVKAEAMRLGIAKGTGELTEAQKVQARISLITKGLADANGDMARTFGGAANQMRAFEGRLVNLKAEAGAAFQPITDEVLLLANSALAVLNRELDGNRAAIKDWAADSMKAGGDIVGAFENVGSAVGFLLDAAQAVNFAFVGLHVTLAQFDLLTLKLFKPLNEALGADTGIGEAQAELDRLAARFVEIENQGWNSDRIKKFFSDVRAEADKTKKTMTPGKLPMGGIEGAIAAGLLGKARGGAGAGGGTAAGPNALKEQAKDAKELRDTVRDTFKEWSLGLATIDAETPRQKTIAELFVKGVDPALILGLQALDAQLTDLEEKANLKDKAGQIIESTRSPMEKFKAEAAELQKMLDAKLIGQSTFDRALLEAGQGLKGEGATGPVGNAGALKADSNEARTAILAFRQGGKGEANRELLNVNKGQLDRQGEMLAELKKLAAGREAPKVALRTDPLGDKVA